MGEVNWNTVFEQTNPDGRYTLQIKWLPPQKSGCIVQFVEIEVPIGTIPSNVYKKPYFEAWLVEDGMVIHDGDGPDEYDDSFSNEENGILPINRQLAIDGVQYSMRRANANHSYIQFNCTVFWVDKETSTYETIRGWRRGFDNGIVMARELRSSYNKPVGLGDGKERKFKADFILQES